MSILLFRIQTFLFMYTYEYMSIYFVYTYIYTSDYIYSCFNFSSNAFNLFSNSIKDITKSLTCILQLFCFCNNIFSLFFS